VRTWYAANSREMVATLMINGRTIFSVVRKLAPHPGAKSARQSGGPKQQRPAFIQRWGKYLNPKPRQRARRHHPPVNESHIC
jgi:hypothetical protein